MRSHRLLVAVVIAFSAAAEAAPAATITYLQDLREVHALGAVDTGDELVVESDTVQPSPHFSAFSTALDFGQGAASQVSALGAVATTARGDARGFYDLLEYGGGYSRFHIVFEVDETTPWTLEGTLHRENVLGGYNNARGSVVLSSSDGTTIFSAELPPNPDTANIDPLTLPVLATGEIGPGQYELFIEAASGHPDLTWSGYASYDLHFAVPEPGTLALLLAGLAALSALGSSTGCR